MGEFMIKKQSKYKKIFAENSCKTKSIFIKLPILFMFSLFICFSQESVAMEWDKELFDDRGSRPGYPMFYESTWTPNKMPNRDFSSLSFSGGNKDENMWNNPNTNLGYCLRYFKNNRKDLEIGEAWIMPVWEGNTKNICNVRVYCYFNYKKSPNDELLDLQIKIKRMELENLMKNKK